MRLQQLTPLNYGDNMFNMRSKMINKGENNGN